MPESLEREDVRLELRQMNLAIEQYAAQVDELDAALLSIDEENKRDDVSRQMVEYEASTLQQSAGVAAEDALDNMVRAQNQLRIIRRRNELLARENTVQKKQLLDRRSVLQSTSLELDMIVDATGWHKDFALDSDEQAAHKVEVQQMLTTESTICRELKAAQVIIQKKGQLIVKLSADIEKQKERKAVLNELHNSVRVKQRECEELKLKLQRLRLEDSKTEQALVALEDSLSGAATLSCMERDKDYLSDAVSEMKLACRRQDTVVKAQLARQQQLQSRLDTVMQSLREMNLVREFERNVAKSALVPSASREEPEDVSQILPEDECVPIDTYRLLYKNNEVMRVGVARKNMLVLEKESVVQAMEGKLARYVENYNKSVRSEDHLRYNKDTEANDLMESLQDQHQTYRSKIEDMVSENNKLKNRLYRSTPSRRSIKNY